MLHSSCSRATTQAATRLSGGYCGRSRWRISHTHTHTVGVHRARSWSHRKLARCYIRSKIARIQNGQRPTVLHTLYNYNCSITHTQRQHLLYTFHLGVETKSLIYERLVFFLYLWQLRNAVEQLLLI